VVAAAGIVWATSLLVFAARRAFFADRPAGVPGLLARPRNLTDRRGDFTARPMDALSELLRAVKLSGAMFFDAECSKPWRLRAAPSRSMACYVTCEASHVIEFHLVTQGEGYIRVGEETTPFTAGDTVMVPHGDASTVGYESEAAFNRAFKRKFGKPPAQYRRAFREQKRAVPA
jgi:hypothetical protein